MAAEPSQCSSIDAWWDAKSSTETTPAASGSGGPSHACSELDPHPAAAPASRHKAPQSTTRMPALYRRGVKRMRRSRPLCTRLTLEMRPSQRYTDGAPRQPVTPPGARPASEDAHRRARRAIPSLTRSGQSPSRPVCSRTPRTPRSSPELDVTLCWPARPRRTCLGRARRQAPETRPAGVAANEAGAGRSHEGEPLRQHVAHRDVTGCDVPSACADRDREAHRLRHPAPGCGSHPCPGSRPEAGAP